METDDRPLKRNARAHAMPAEKTVVAVSFDFKLFCSRVTRDA